MTEAAAAKMPSSCSSVLCLSILVFTILAGSIHGERTKDKMYESIEGSAACFRRLNGTHQFGCTSRRGGNVGVIAVVDSDSELAWLLGNASAAPYMVMLPPHMFTRQVLFSLRDSGRVSGVLLWGGNATNELTAFSPDSTCPNIDEPKGVAGCDSAHPWNPPGSDLLHHDLGFPVFTLDSEDTLDTIRQCYEKHNAGDRASQTKRSLCALEMNAFMFAAVDSRTCIRRSNSAHNLNPVRYCDPLGDRNVFSTLFLRQEATPTLALAARLDAASLFDGRAAGAAATVPGAVALVATAALLGDMLPSNARDSASANVLFALFHGEAHGLIGSSRAAYDMSRNEFPPPPTDAATETPAAGIKLDDLRGFVELGQLIGPDGRLFVHLANGSSPQMTSFVDQLKREGAALGLTVGPASVPRGLVPPGSLASFTHLRPELPGLLLAGHDAAFTNKFYHSQYDTALRMGYLPGETGDGSIQQALGKVSLALAKTVFHSLTGKVYTGHVSQPNITLVDSLLECLLITYNCSLFQAATPPGQSLPDTTPSHYVGVSVSGNLATALIAQALALVTGTQTALTQEQCRQENNRTETQLLWMSGWSRGNDTGVCIETTMGFTPAVSPAFVIEDYDWLSGEFSTWTESTWHEFSVRLFLVPSAAHEEFTLCVGLFVLTASILAVAFLSKKADVLFADHTVLAAAC